MKGWLFYLCGSAQPILLHEAQTQCQDGTVKCQGGIREIIESDLRPTLTFIICTTCIL